MDAETRIDHSDNGHKVGESVSKIRVLQIVHTLKRAGAEQLVYELARSNQDWLETAVVCLDEEGPLAQELQAIGSRVYFTHRKAGLDFSQVSKISNVIRDFHPDVIHAHQYTPFFYGALAARRARMGKLLFTEHGRHWPDIVGWKRRLFNRWLSGRADKMIAVCEFAKSRLVKKEGFNADRIEVIYNGVDFDRVADCADRQSVREELGLPLDGNVKLIAQVGTFRAVKDQATAIRAFDIVRKNDRNVILVFVGDGDDLAACKKLSAELGLESVIKFLGQRSDVARILSAVDIMLMTSLSEAHSVSLLEGMAAGLPIVTTDVGGNAESVIDGQNGLLARAGDSADIAKALLQLLANPQQQEQMGRDGLNRVKKYFSQAQMHQRYLEIYRELASLGGRV